MQFNCHIDISQVVSLLSSQFIVKPKENNWLLENINKHRQLNMQPWENYSGISNHLAVLEKVKKIEENAKESGYSFTLLYQIDGVLNFKCPKRGKFSLKLIY